MKTHLVKKTKRVVNKKIAICFLVLVFGLLAFIYVRSHITTSRISPAKRTIYIGAWVQGLWNNLSHELDSQKLKDFEKLVNKKMAIAHVYRDWGELPQENFVTELQQLDKAGWMPMVSSSPHYERDCNAPGVPLYAAIAQGKCDVLLSEIARSFKAYGKPVLFRFAWEVNVPTLPWSLSMTKSTTGDYVSAWRRFHDIMKQEGATNVKWVFSPNVKSYAQDLSYKYIYPGDDVVDWVALDGYNWGTTQNWSKWSSFTDIFKDSYDEMAILAPNKPLMIAEINSANVGGDQSEWLADALGTQIPNNFPKVKAVVLFDEDKTATDGVDWRIENSNKSIGVLRYIFQNNPLYSSSFND